MKNSKRIIALVLAALALCSMSLGAFATEETTAVEETTAAAETTTAAAEETTAAAETTTVPEETTTQKAEVYVDNGALIARQKYLADTAAEEKAWDGDEDTYTDSEGKTLKYVNNKNYIVSSDNADYLYRVLEDGTIAVIYNPDAEKFDGEAEIPSSLDGKTVSKIDAYAFYFQNKVTAIRVPDSVKEIGYYAFAYCTALQRIAFGNGLEFVSYQAFNGINAAFEIYFSCTEAEADQIVVWDSKNSNAKTSFNWMSVNKRAPVYYEVNTDDLDEIKGELNLIEWFWEHFKSYVLMFWEYNKYLFEEGISILKSWFGIEG